MSSSKHLIINADDFGISRGVNLGIVEAAQAGSVTSASMMVNLPDFADAVDRSTSCPNVSLGLHLNFTVGRPLTGARSLTRRGTGEFYPFPSLLARASVGLVDASDVAAECLAQIDRMLDEGIKPTHLDSHRHVHAHPAFARAVVEAAAARGIFQIRVPRERFTMNVGDWGASVKKLALRVGTTLSQQRIGRKGTPHFAGVSLQGGKFFAKRLFDLISSLPAGTTELMTHPGYADASLAARDSYTLERVTELRVLCSGEFRDLLERSDVTLTSFGKSRTSASADRELAQHH
jgi:chitin disaccharide deacetylase